MRTSRRPSCMFASVSTPLTRNRRNAEERRFWRSSNMTRRAHSRIRSRTDEYNPDESAWQRNFKRSVLSERTDWSRGTPAWPTNRGDAGRRGDRRGARRRSPEATSRTGRTAWRWPGRPIARPSRPGSRLAGRSMATGLTRRGSAAWPPGRAVGAGHDDQHVERHVQERVEVEQPRELEQVPHLAAGGRVPGGDLQRDVRHADVGRGSGSRRGEAGRTGTGCRSSIPPTAGRLRGRVGRWDRPVGRPGRPAR